MSSSNGKIVLATVKGDVHDIGKNIVGVVLQCNNYDVIDLGVMVPAEKIIQTAQQERADIVGLSGLITPSLDEMCHVATEFERQGFDIPLLIGGATTSRVHTAVKIHPNYRRGQTVYVNDASRAVGVVSSLLSRDARERYVGDVRAEYARIAAAHARGEENKQRLPLTDCARQRAEARTGPATTCRRCRAFSARAHSSDIPIAELVDYIDWSPFFATWELTGKYPGDPAGRDRRRGGAKSLRRRAGDAEEDDRRELVSRQRRHRFLAGQQRRRRYSGLRRRAKRNKPIATLHTLRQQLARREGRANVALADFVAPRASGLRDYIGAFAVTAGLAKKAVVERFKHRQ